MFALNANAQNTGTAPYVNSIHEYTVSKSTAIGTTTLAWVVTTGAQGTEYNIMLGADSETMKIQWLIAGTYTLQLSETRVGTNACPTIREMIVIVGDNNFDVIASIQTAKEDCATVTSPVVDASSDGLNSNDNFGTTSRTFAVTATGIQNTLKWSFVYAVTSGIENLGSLTTSVAAANTSIAGNTVTVDAATKEVLITVTYQTNADRQDLDFDLNLAITNAMDVNLTPNKSGDNSIDYTIIAVPATTGITTDN